MQNRARFHFDNLYHTREQMMIGPYIVKQVGDLSCEAGYRYPPHTQDVHEISYVVSGRGVFCANGERFDVRRGTLFVNAADDVHEIVSSMDDPIRYMYLGFRAQKPIASPIIQTLESFYARPVNRIGENMFEVQETFIHLLDEIVVADPYTELLKECCIHQLVCQVYRLLNPRDNRSYLIGAGEKTDVQRLVYDIAHYIDTNVGRLTTLAALSDQFGYSYAYIAKVFSQQMGESLYAYYAKRRFEKARDYLVHGVSVTEAARLLGYQSIHAFSRAFKKDSGLCPSEFARTLPDAQIDPPSALKGDANP